MPWQAWWLFASFLLAVVAAKKKIRACIHAPALYEAKEGHVKGKRWSSISIYKGIHKMFSAQGSSNYYFIVTTTRHNRRAFKFFLRVVACLPECCAYCGSLAMDPNEFM